MSETWWVDPAWRGSLRAAGLADFTSAWALCVQPTEDVNRRKGGWASVHRIAVRDAPDACSAIYLKQQENYLTRSARQPLGEPVAARELRNLRAFQSDRLPVPRVVCQGISQGDAGPRTLLGTADLVGYQELDAALQSAAVDTGTRVAVIKGAGALIGHLHRARWEYRCLYPKHVFVKLSPGDAPHFSFIDLEKARKRIRVRYGALRDLATFTHRCPDWAAPDWDAFYRGYFADDYSEQRQQRVMEQVRARRARRG